MYLLLSISQFQSVRIFHLNISSSVSPLLGLEFEIIQPVDVPRQGQREASDLLLSLLADFPKYVLRITHVRGV
jgi:hypothetical protein